jgi:hypothetical protein
MKDLKYFGVPKSLGDFTILKINKIVVNTNAHT